MRMYSLQKILRAGLLGIVLASTCDQSLQSKETASGKNGVTVEVSLPYAVSAGHPVEMVVNVTNTGSKPVFFTRWICALGIHLVDSNKATPEMTPREKKGPDSVIDYGNVFAILPIKELKPREHHEWRVDLGTLFILKPGEYFLSLKMKLSQPALGEKALFEISTHPIGFAVR